MTVLVESVPGVPPAEIWPAVAYTTIPVTISAYDDARRSAVIELVMLDPVEIAARVLASCCMPLTPITVTPLLVRATVHATDIDDGRADKLAPALITALFCARRKTPAIESRVAPTLRDAEVRPRETAVGTACTLAPALGWALPLPST